MSHIEVLYRCPICEKAYSSQSKAIKCRNLHPIISEKWAVSSSGKSVLINENCTSNGYGGLNWALKEADLSDNIEERKLQLENKRRNY